MQDKPWSNSLLLLTVKSPFAQFIYTIDCFEVNSGKHSIYTFSANEVSFSLIGKDVLKLLVLISINLNDY